MQTIRWCAGFAVVLIMASLASGCTTSMTSMNDARAYEPKEVQVAANMQTNLHSNIARGAVRGVGSTAEVFDRDSEEPIGEEAFRSWLDLAIMAALFRPGQHTPEVIARVGLTDKVLEGIDVGFRTNAKYFKGDAKLQFWESQDSRQFASVMLGYAHHRSWVEDWVGWLTLSDFKRSDFDIQALWGMEFGEFFKLNLGPHIILSRVSVEHKLPGWLVDRLPEQVRRFDPSQIFKNEWLGYYGGNVSFMIGYKYVYLAADFGAFWMNFTPEIIGEERDFSGAALSAAGGLSLHYDF